jgi:hypothetical protein
MVAPERPLAASGTKIASDNKFSQSIEKDCKLSFPAVEKAYPWGKWSFHWQSECKLRPADAFLVKMICTRICHHVPVQIFLTISIESTFNFFWRNLPQFLSLFRVLQIPKKYWKLHDTHRMKLQSLVISTNSTSRQSVSGVARFRIEFCIANCASPDENIQISYRFQESGFSYLSVLLSSIWLSGNN